MRLAKQEKRFLLRFAAFFFIPFAIIHFIDFTLLNTAVARIETFLLSLLGYAPLLQGTIISVASERFNIIVDCTGLVLVILFAALLYSTPIKEAARKRALLWGIPFLFAFNILRLLLTLVVGAVLGPAALDATHLLLWFIDSAVVLFIWARVAGVKLLQTI